MQTYPGIPLSEIPGDVPAHLECTLYRMGHTHSIQTLRWWKLCSNHENHPGEEMATMIYRYTQSAGKLLPTKNVPTVFSDAHLIDSWAQTPVSVIQQAGKIIDSNVVNGRYSLAQGSCKLVRNIEKCSVSSMNSFNKSL